MACPTFLIKRHQDAIPLAIMPGPVQGLMSDGRRVRVFFVGTGAILLPVEEREGHGRGSIVARMQK
jgi:hypothetical protein